VVCTFGILSFRALLDGAAPLIERVTYMAPEQVRGDRIDRRADVFSLGAMLRDLCTLRADRPPDVEGIIMKALAPEREAPGEPARNEIWREGSRESAICSLAGPLAEAIHLREDVHDVLDRNRSDRAAARAAIDQFVIMPKARVAAFNYLLREAECLVCQQWRVIVELAEALETHRKLTGEQIGLIIRETVTEAAAGRWGN